MLTFKSNTLQMLANVSMQNISSFSTGKIDSMTRNWNMNWMLATDFFQFCLRIFHEQSATRPHNFLVDPRKWNIKPKCGANMYLTLHALYPPLYFRDLFFCVSLLSFELSQWEIYSFIWITLDYLADQMMQKVKAPIIYTTGNKINLCS